MATYWASAFSVAIPAGATDIACLENPNGASISLVGVALYGVGAANGTINVSVIRRSSLNSGGTSFLITPTPSDEQGISQAVLRCYTVNPTTLGALNGIFRQLQWDVTTNGSSASPSGAATLNFASIVPPAGLPIMRSPVSAFCVSFNGSPIAATLSVDMVWTEY